MSAEPLSPLALGTMNFGGRTDRREAESIIHSALDHGINWFDTANNYNDGMAETILGDVLHQRRNEVVIATKVGFGQVFGTDEGLSRAAIFRAVEGSLRRLQTDYLDVYYLHRPDAGTPIEETLTAIELLFEQGKIRAFGLANFASWHILEIQAVCDQLAIPRPVISQVPYSMLMRQLDIEYNAFSKKHWIKTHIYNPLAGGMLSGNYQGPADIANGTRFRESPYYRRRYWHDPFFTAVRSLREIAEKDGRSLPELAYAWLATCRRGDTIIIGPAVRQHLIVAAESIQKSISAEAIQSIDDIYYNIFGQLAYARYS